MTETKRIIRDRTEFTGKHLRSIKTLYRQSLERGFVGDRPESYIDSIVFLGYANAVVDHRNRVQAFTVIRPLAWDPGSEPVLYGECTLWRGKDAAWPELRALLRNTARNWGAHYLYGAFYKGNGNAANFHAIEDGFQRVAVDQIPDAVKREVSHYEDIEILRLTIH